MDHFTVIGAGNCRFCAKAIYMLEQNNKEFTYLNLEDNLWIVALFKLADLKTVPQVFNGHKYIGGCSDLESYLEGDAKNG